MTATIRVILMATLHDHDDRVVSVEAGSAVLSGYVDLVNGVPDLLRQVADDYTEIVGEDQFAMDRWLGS